MFKQLTLINLLFCIFCNTLSAQIVINEYLSSNVSGITDEDGDHSDWIEIFNPTNQPVNMRGYQISDKRDNSESWTFPEVNIASQSYLLLFASGKDRDGVAPKYHTIIRQGDQWRYMITQSITTTDWRTSATNDSHWAEGPSGFGYGDNDDATVLSNAQIVLLRKEFQIDDPAAVTEMLLHVDYDDGFIAFINGEMVAMGGISSYSNDYLTATASGHEAVMYSGGTPEEFNLTAAIPLLKKGTNLIAIQGHNAGSSSTDFSLIPFLTISSENFTTNDVASFINAGTENLHTNFKISKEGETLYLFNATSEIIDSTKAVALDDDISFGRSSDGDNQWAYFTEPTPGSANASPIDSIVIDSVRFSQPAGFYTNPFSLSLQSTSTRAGNIRFTTDGSIPTMNSSLYFGPFTIERTTVVRAAWFGENEQSTNPVNTCTYIFDSPNGLPVISLSTDPKNFFDWNEGILVEGPNAQSADPHYGANYWMEWEKPVNLEFFDKQQEQQINQGAGVQVTGNWSRMNAQKSMALYARKTYGKGAFDYKFFHDRDNDKYESFILRNSGNDWNHSMFRDGLTSEIARDMNMERLAYQPTKIYLNGEYWGILNMREKPNEHYFEDNFNIDEENINLLEIDGSIILGSNDEYVELKKIITDQNLALNENYRKVCSMIDIDGFIDYQILEIFADNGDWPGNNIKYWKTTGDAGKWRWLIFDTDFGFNLFGNNGNTLSFATATNGPSWPNPPWSTLFLRKLLTNQEFKNQFISRFSDCLNTNLFPDILRSKVDSLSQNIDPEISDHMSKWGSSYYRWLEEVDKINSFVLGRRGIMRNYMRNFFSFKYDHTLTVSVSNMNGGKVKINSIIPQSYPFQGYYFGEVPVTIKAIPNPGYRFVRWENASSEDTQSITFNLTENRSYKACFEPVSDQEQHIVINEINYKSPEEFDAGDWIELYNAGGQTVDLSGWILSDTNPDSCYVFPEGLLLYPGDYWVVTAQPKKFSAIFPAVKNTAGNLPFGLSSSGDVIFLYNHTGSLIDKVSYSMRTPWPPEPCGFGPTLELKNPESDNNIGENWEAGITGGTPGQTNSVFVSSGIATTANFKAVCFPTTFTDYTTLQFFIENGGKYTVQILDLQGRLHERTDGFAREGNSCSIDLFTNASRFPNGIYIVRVQTNESSQTMKVVKR